MSVTAPEREDRRAGVPQGPRTPVLPAALRSRSEWLPFAACAGEDVELFFDCESPYNRELAKMICAGCPVRAQCLQARMDEERSVPDERGVVHSPWRNLRDRYGVCGGMTSTERWDLEYPDLVAKRKERDAKRRARKRQGQAAEVVAAG